MGFGIGRAAAVVNVAANRVDATECGTSEFEAGSVALGC